jgi:hypothetical protein
MTAEFGSLAQKRERKIPPLVFILLALVLAGGAGFWYLDQQSHRVLTTKLVLTPEAKAYVKNLKLSEVEMKASDAYLKDQSLVEVVGKVTNAGDRKLKSVDLTCVFYDPYGRVVLREQVGMLPARAGGLAPGETKSFRLPFDDLPESWNQALPQLVIAQIAFD